MIVRQIIYFDVPCTLACDAQCQKAWGICSRPKVSYDPNDADDIAYLSDIEIDGNAPDDPGTYEGGHGKPQHPRYRLNKWCARECERSIIVNAQEGVVALPDWSKRRFNQPWKHEEATHDR